MITCQFENGNGAHLRHVTVNAIVVKDNKILLGKRGTYKGKPMLESGKWALIGGFMDRDENLEQAIRREILEETGWTITDLQLLRIKDNPDRPAEDRQNVEFVFIAQAAESEDMHDEEVSRLQWFALDGLPAKDTIAFDHADELELYKKYLEEKFSIPVIGKK